MSALSLFRPKSPGDGKSGRRGTRLEFDERMTIVPYQLCNVKGCTGYRSRLSGFCSKHHEALRLYGHPTLKPPAGRSRKRWLHVIRPMVNQVLNQDASVELRGYCALIRSQARTWSGRLKSPKQRRCASLLSEATDEQLLSALVAFAAAEDRRDLRNEVPRYYLTERPKRLTLYQGRQLGVWLRSAGAFKGIKGNVMEKAAAAVSVLFVSYRAPTQVMQIAGALYSLLGPRFGDDLAAVIRESRERDREREEREHRERYPYGGPDENGRVYIFKSPRTTEEPPE